jgi:hypothetical protein
MVDMDAPGDVVDDLQVIYYFPQHPNILFDNVLDLCTHVN